GALTRLEQLVEEATPARPHALIAEAVDVIIFLSRASGARRVEQALRLTGLEGIEYRTEPLAAPFLNIVN
ncbi:MAG TPA: P-type conjugative transfer ATPase TrbB, partial [Hyphomonas sp.]|nr:P-type conjugative transfer ATPase TrbB [Hyphomonas sp.]